MTEAARASLRLLDADESAARRRVVVAADVPDAPVAGPRRPRPRRRPARRRRSRWRRSRRCTSTTPTPRRPWPRRPRRSSRPTSATPGAQETVDDAEGYELSWYANQEIAALLAAALTRRPSADRTAGSRGTIGSWTPSPTRRRRATSRSAPTRRAAPRPTALAAALDELAARPRRADDDDRRPGPDGRRRAHRGAWPRTGTSCVLGETAPGHRGRRRGRDRRRARRGAGLARRCPSTSAPRCSCAPPTCSSTTWRDRLNAATMLGQSKSGAAGRDRRGVRARRLPALQRALRAADPRAAAAELGR